MTAVAAEWADVAQALHIAPPAAPMQPRDPARPAANLGLVMRSPSSRRDLRRILMVIGAIRGGRPRPRPEDAEAVRTSEVVAALMQAHATLVTRLLTAGGAISDPDRLARFARRIAEVGSGRPIGDAESVQHWVADVASILRDER